MEITVRHDVYIHDAVPDPRIDQVLTALRALTTQGARVLQALSEIDAATTELADQIEEWKGSVSGPDSDRILARMTQAGKRLRDMAADPSASSAPPTQET